MTVQGVGNFSKKALLHTGDLLTITKIRPNDTLFWCPVSTSPCTCNAVTPKTKSMAPAPGDYGLTYVKVEFFPHDSPELVARASCFPFLVNKWGNRPEFAFPRAKWLAYTESSYEREIHCECPSKILSKIPHVLIVQQNTLNAEKRLSTPGQKKCPCSPLSAS